MIVKKLENQGVLFESPFDQELDPENRWIKFSGIIPWDQLSDFYLSRMDSKMGAAIKDASIVLGALIVKHDESLGDEATIFAIQENLYMQYFLGLATASPDFWKSNLDKSSDFYG